MAGSKKSPRSPKSKKSPRSPKSKKSPRSPKKGKRCRKVSRPIEYESPLGKKVRNCIPVKTAWNEILKRKRAEMPKKLLKEIMFASQPCYKWYLAHVDKVNNRVPIIADKIEEALQH